MYGIDLSARLLQLQSGELIGIFVEGATDMAVGVIILLLLFWQSANRQSRYWSLFSGY